MWRSHNEFRRQLTPGTNCRLTWARLVLSGYFFREIFALRWRRSVRKWMLCLLSCLFACFTAVCRVSGFARDLRYGEEHRVPEEGYQRQRKPDEGGTNEAGDQNASSEHGAMS